MTLKELVIAGTQSSERCKPILKKRRCPEGGKLLQNAVGEGEGCEHDTDRKYAIVQPQHSPRLMGESSSELVSRCPVKSERQLRVGQPSKTSHLQQT